MGERRWGGGFTYQDTPQVRPCRLFLDFLSRKVLVSESPSPASTETEYILSETIAVSDSSKPWVYSTLLQDLTRQEVEDERTWTFYSAS